MADGTILKFNYIGLLGLINYFLGDWGSFEGWCTARAVNPLAESPRRMISLMRYFVEMDMSDETRGKFRNSIEHPVVKAPKIKSPTSGKIVPLNPTERWRAPEGWTPPGWNEEKSFAAAQSFMGFKASVK